MLAVLLVLACSYIMRSPRPEKAFLALVKRYFQSCEYLLGALGQPKPPISFMGRARWAFHRQEIRSLPSKLGNWGHSVSPKTFPGTKPEQIAELVASFQVLTARIDDLIDARMVPHAEKLVREFGGELREWRQVFEQGFARWVDPEKIHDPEDLRPQLARRLERLNRRVHEVLNDSSGEEALTKEESRNFYRILGCFRGLANSAISHAGLSGRIDWEELREERFS